MPVLPAATHSQFSALLRSFIARFFDNEITTGTNDLKASFFWLIAFLAPLGILLPWFMMFDYSFVFAQGGAELLRRLSMADKTLYVGLGMVAAGGLGVVTWNSLILDRRDALVLGVLPVHGPTIVAAKLAALGAYVGIVTAGMHAGGSVSFGLILSEGMPLSFAARGIVAHFVASCLASMFMLFAITAVQGVVLTLTGPRVFSRVSPALQLAVTALLLGTFLSLPAISAAVVSGSTGDSWLVLTPPVWFLGVYEWVLGTSNPALLRLTAIAFIGTAAVVSHDGHQLSIGAPASDEHSGRGRLPSSRTPPSLVPCLARTHSGAWPWSPRSPSVHAHHAEARRATSVPARAVRWRDRGDSSCRSPCLRCGS